MGSGGEARFSTTSAASSAVMKYRLAGEAPSSVTVISAAGWSLLTRDQSDSDSILPPEVSPTTRGPRLAAHPVRESVIRHAISSAETLVFISYRHVKSAPFTGHRRVFVPPPSPLRPCCVPAPFRLLSTCNR